jgi:hypothetical protein
MMVLAFQLYIGFVLLQGAFMKSIQNTTDHNIAIASLKSAVDRLEERIENMTVIQTQGKVFIIRGGRQLGRPCDTELMGREPLCTTSEDINPEPEMECIYSVFLLRTRAWCNDDFNLFIFQMQGHSDPSSDFYFFNS